MRRAAGCRRTNYRRGCHARGLGPDRCQSLAGDVGIDRAPKRGARTTGRTLNPGYQISIRVEAAARDVEFVSTVRPVNDVVRFGDGRPSEAKELVTMCAPLRKKPVNLAQISPVVAGEKRHRLVGRLWGNEGPL